MGKLSRVKRLNQVFINLLYTGQVQAMQIVIPNDLAKMMVTMNTMKMTNDRNIRQTNT